MKTRSPALRVGRTVRGGKEERKKRKNGIMATRCSMLDREKRSASRPQGRVCSPLQSIPAALCSPVSLSVSVLSTCVFASKKFYHSLLVNPVATRGIRAFEKGTGAKTSFVPSRESRGLTRYQTQTYIPASFLHALNTSIKTLREILGTIEIFTPQDSRVRNLVHE